MRLMVILPQLTIYLKKEYTLDLFEKYKTTTIYDEYEEDLSWDIVKAMQEANKHEHTRQNSIDEFRKAIIKDKDEILTFLLSMTPD